MSDSPPIGSPTSPDPLLGQILGGNYRIESLLGTGGMGNVYRAQHLRLPKTFAVKVLRRDLVNQDPAALDRFRREAEVASSIGHAHIVQVVDLHSLPDGSLYMVMEYLEGETLATRLERTGFLPIRRCQHLLEQVVSALEAAHQHGIIHRDIKPENIFLHARPEEADFVKLLDFGLSKIVGGRRLTADLSVLGTPWYMSPEQARGDTDIDHRADVYALAVVFYQVLTGHVPFEGATIYETLTRIATQDPPPLSHHVDGISPGLEAAVLRALSKSREDRPSSVGEFWDEALRGVESTLANGRMQPPRAPHAPVPLAQPLEAVAPGVEGSETDGTLPSMRAAPPPANPLAPSSAPVAVAAPRRDSLVDAGPFRDRTGPVLIGLVVLVALVGTSVFVAHRLSRHADPLPIPEASPLPALPPALAPPPVPSVMVTTTPGPTSTKAAPTPNPVVHATEDAHAPRPELVIHPDPASAPKHGKPARHAKTGPGLFTTLEDDGN